MINLQLSKQGIHWLVSRDHVTGSGQEFTADHVLGFRLDRGLKPGYYSGKLLAVCFLSKFSRGYEVKRFG